MVSPTSLAAYRALTPGLGSIQARVLDFIEACGPDGCISEQILQDFVITKSKKDSGTVTTRVSELERKGLVFRAGDTRAASSGRQQMVVRHIKYASHPSVPAPKREKKDPLKNPFIKGFYAATKLVHGSPDYLSARVALSGELKRILKPYMESEE